MAYEKELMPRAQRAERAVFHLQDYDPQQQEFLNFVLQQLRSFSFRIFAT